MLSSVYTPFFIKSIIFSQVIIKKSLVKLDIHFSDFILNYFVGCTLCCRVNKDQAIKD